MRDKDRISKLKPFKDANYENVDLDRLVMYAMGKLEEIGADLSFENAVIAAFRLFPKKFSLLGFPSYPDSLRVYTCLWRCTTDRKKKWLGGKIHQGFIITDRSRLYIEEAENLLHGLLPERQKVTSRTRRKELLLEEVASSPAYLKYIDGKADAISEADVCYVLQGTLDSSRDTLKENLAILRRYAEELGRNDVSGFLTSLQKGFEYFFENRRKM